MLEDLEKRVREAKENSMSRLPVNLNVLDALIKMAKRGEDANPWPSRRGISVAAERALANMEGN